MSSRILFTSGLLLTLMFCSHGFAFQQEAETSNLPDLEKLWEDLSSNQPGVASAAVLEFSKYPDEVVEFFKVKIRAIRLNDTSYEELMADLVGEDEATAKAAYHQLNFRDPRLLGNVQSLMDRCETPSKRHDWLRY